MEWGSIIQSAIVSLSTILILWYMQKLAQKEVTQNQDGSTTLKVSKLYSTVGYVSIVAGLILLIPVFWSDEENIFFIALPIILFFTLGGIYTVLHAKNHSLQFNNERIIVTSWAKVQRSLRWEEIDSIKLNIWSGNICIKGFGNQLKVNQYLVGMSAFVQKIEEKTKWTAKELKLNYK